MPDKPNNVIKITDDIGIIMKYPPSTLYDDKEFLNSEDEHLFKLIIRCVDKIYQGDEVYEASSYSKEELSEFLEDLSVKVFEQIQKFFEETPKLSYTIKYKNSLDNKREIHLNSLNDFFTLR
jgi:t-SNARE complex subunit (syntaxin)